jgi:type II restriction enzyme
MHLHLPTPPATYTSPSQRARIATEQWMQENMYCPACGAPVLHHFQANRPVADFCCERCSAEYELKSKWKSITLGKKINDGAYDTMIERIQALNNPNFFFMTHNEGRVNQLVLVPRFFFTPSVIQKRNPLSDTARRAGWVGCNINLNALPESGKIAIIKAGQVVKSADVVERYRCIARLESNSLSLRGWLLDVLRCVERTPTQEFTLQQIYAFLPELQVLHPENHHLKAKIRQQLQWLRNRDLIRFTARGRYQKLF